MITRDTTSNTQIKRVPERGDNTRLEYLGDGFNMTTFKAKVVVVANEDNPLGSVSNEFSREEWIVVD